MDHNAVSVCDVTNHLMLNNQTDYYINVSVNTTKETYQ